jgi:tripartite-type tricarboxylate transporter receptor subunit TctC
MTIRQHTFLQCAAILLVAVSIATSLSSPAFSEPLRIIVGFPAGSGIDVLTRLVAEHIQSATNNPVIVDNRPGAGGRIAAEAVARAEPDGNTILSAPIVTTASRRSSTRI